MRDILNTTFMGMALIIGGLILFVAYKVFDELLGEVPSAILLFSLFCFLAGSTLKFLAGVH